VPPKVPSSVGSKKIPTPHALLPGLKGGIVELELTPFDLFAAASGRRQRRAGPSAALDRANHYRGIVKGDPTRWPRQRLPR